VFSPGKSFEAAAVREHQDGQNITVPGLALPAPMPLAASAARPGATALVARGVPERALRFTSADSGSERFFGDFLLSKATSFCAEEGTGIGSLADDSVAVTFFAVQFFVVIVIRPQRGAFERDAGEQSA